MIKYLLLILLLCACDLHTAQITIKKYDDFKNVLLCKPEIFAHEEAIVLAFTSLDGYHQFLSVGDLYCKKGKVYFEMPSHFLNHEIAPGDSVEFFHKRWGDRFYFHSTLFLIKLVP